MNIKTLYLLLSILITQGTILAQSQKVDLGIEETIKYINELVESNSETYPYTQIEEIKNGRLILKSFGCTDNESWNAWVKHGVETEKKIGKCNDTLTLHYNRQQVILKNVFFKVNSDTLFYLGKSDAYIFIIGAPIHPAKEIQDNYKAFIKRKNITSFYSFRTEKFQDTEKQLYDSYNFEFNSSQYNIEKLYNSLEHLFKLVMEKQNLWNIDIKDDDPFAPQNYKNKD